MELGLFQGSYSIQEANVLGSMISISMCPRGQVPTRPTGNNRLATLTLASRNVRNVPAVDGR
jgi:hypothetical protein